MVGLKIVAKFILLEKDLFPSDVDVCWLLQLLGGVTVRCRTYDQEVVSSTPGQVTIKRLLIGWVTICRR